MAIATPTVLDTASASTSSATITSASISPAANALLIVVSGAGVGVASTPAPASISDTLSGGNLTWTKYENSRADSVSESLAIFVAKTGATPGSGTITTTWTNTNSNRRIQFVCQIASGFNTTTPVAQNKTNTGTANTLSMTLNSTPAADSMVFAGVTSRQASVPNIGAGANFTELTETTSSTNFATQVQYDNANATTTCNWTSTGTLGNVGIAIEIAAAAGGGTTYNDTLGLSTVATTGQSTQASLGNSVALATVATVSDASQASLGNAVSLSSVATTSQGSQATLGDAVSLSSVATIDAIHGLILVDAIDLDATATIETGASYLLFADLDLPVTATASVASQLVADDTLILNVLALVAMAGEGGEAIEPVLIIYSADIEVRFVATANMPVRLVASQEVEI